jgi:hypothetical protein
MDDLYGKKAKKYKLKYLKLKKEMEGGGFWTYPQATYPHATNTLGPFLHGPNPQGLYLQRHNPQIPFPHGPNPRATYPQGPYSQGPNQQATNQHDNRMNQVRLISKTHGCVFYPPILNNILNISEIPTINLNDFGKLLIYKDFQNELDNYDIANEIKYQHIPKIYANPITSNSLNSLNIIKKINCTYVKMYNNINNWGCLIYKNVGITLDKCDINRSNILFILTSLKNSIRYFFLPFNTKRKYFYFDLHPRNITYNETQKKSIFYQFWFSITFRK